ncbi:MAG: hypothetical protein K0R17_2685 [Rariglobus sp.]|jgi:hypothetical protein|nr:hypothetical protein [Rariglobus sp.]
MNTPSVPSRHCRVRIQRSHPVRRFLGVLLSALTFSAFALSSAHAVPIILNSSETAAPGDTVYVQGEDFGAGAQLWFRRVLTTDTALAPATQLALITSSSQALSAALPKTMPLGLYALWVKDSGGVLSAPVLINRARATTFEYPEVSPGYTFRIFGRNLRLPGATPAVTFVNGASTYAATVVAAYANDGCELQVQAPAGIVPGTTYTVKVSNGFGHNATANFDVTTAALTMLARPGGADPFALGVPWGPDYAAIAANVINVVTSINPSTGLPYGADNTGAIDSLSIIRQALLDAGNPALHPNGGTVYLPAGTYRIKLTTSSGLNVKSRVVLMGASVDQTIIDDYSDYLNVTAIGVGTGGLDASLSGVTGFTYNHKMTPASTGNPTSIRNHSAGSSKVFFTNLKINMKAGVFDTGDIQTSRIRVGAFIPQGLNNTRVLAQNCTASFFRFGNANALSAPNSYGRHCIFRNNTFSSWYARLSLLYMDHVLVENNRFTRDGAFPYQSFPFPSRETAATSGGTEFTGADVTVLRNVYDGKNLPLCFHNDGESILNQNYIGTKYDYGVPTSVTATTLTNTARTWLTDFYIGKVVAIIKGPGTGQMRFISSNTSDTVTLTAPWTVTPTAASTYALSDLAARYLIKGNNISSAKASIALYTGSYDNAVVGNFSADSTWSVLLRADQRFAENRFNLSWSNIITDNVGVDTLNTWASLIASQLYLVQNHSLLGTPVMGNQFRRNLVEAWIPNKTDGASGLTEGFNNWGKDDATTFTETNLAGLLATTFDDNVAVNTVNAYFLNTHTYQTSIRNQLNLNVTNAKSDATLPGATHASVGTYLNDDLVIQRAVMSGTGTSTGGVSDMLESGGTGSLVAGAGGNTVAITSTAPFTAGSGSYVRFTRVPAGTNAARLQVTPMMPHTSWGRLFDFRSGQWLVNGGFDFFWRPGQTPFAANAMRPIDNGNTPNGLRLTFYNYNATTIKSEVVTPAGGGGITLTGTYAAGFAASQIYHLGVTFATNPQTGVTTMKLFAVAGTGAIDTTVATHLIGTATFTLNPTIVTNTTGWLAGDAWKFGDILGVSTTTVNDYDGLTLYYKDPGSFPGL